MKYKTCKQCQNKKLLKEFSFRKNKCKQCRRENERKYICIEFSCINKVTGKNRRCRLCADKKHSERMKGSGNSNYKDGAKKKKYYCIELNCNNEIHYDTFRIGKRRCNFCSSIGENGHFYGKHHTKKMKINRSKAMKEIWKKKEYREKQVKLMVTGSNFKQNKVEIKLENILNIITPNQYKYVGDGYTFIGGFVPDFIDFKSRKIIELFGNYWHRNTQKKDRQRLKTYEKHGYQTLVIWELELKDLEMIISKIMEFNL